MHLARAIRFACGIQTEDDPHYLAPVGTLLFSIKYP